MMLTRKNFIYIFIVVSLLLIMLNISLDFTSKKEKTVVVYVLSQKEIESKFANALSEFGIPNSWIKKVFSKKKLSDSLNYVFNVSIPKDVTIATLIKEINSQFDIDEVNVVAREERNYGSSVLKIYSDSILKLQANLNYSKKVKRGFAEYSFLVYRSFLGDKSNEKKWKHIFFDFTYLIVPSQVTKESVKELKENYAVLLNNSINETEFALKENYSKQKLVNNIQSILINFGKERAYIIDKNSVLYNSKIYNMIRDEFNSRGIKLHSLQEVQFLKGESFKQLISLFDFYTTSLKGKRGKTFVINANDFLNLQPQIAKQVKRGDKVVKVELK